MMKDIVVVSGSPRKNGNTMRLVKNIEDKLKAVDKELNFKYLHLIDRDLKWCRGCWYANCLKKGGSFCPLKDDRKEIKAILDSADGLIFATPCYGHLPSAIFANFTNRFMYLDHVPEYIGLPTLIIVTAETDGASRAANYIDTMFALPWGCNVTGKLAVKHTFFKTNEVYHKNVMKQIEQLTGIFNQMLSGSRNVEPTLRQYLCFLYNREESILYEKALPGRYEFWESRGWTKSSYYYATNIKLHHRIIGQLFVIALNLYAKRGIGKNHQLRLAEYYGISSR
jgi:multimeric flavodoxin WrbA